MTAAADNNHDRCPRDCPSAIPRECAPVRMIHQITGGTSSRNAIRRGATVLAVLILLMIVCLLAHQTVRTLFLLRRGQDRTLKILQAREILELGKMLDRQEPPASDQQTSRQIVVSMGTEFGKLELFPGGRSVATWPVDSEGNEFPNRPPTVVSSQP
jgi:hypothetical protein